MVYRAVGNQKIYSNVINFSKTFVKTFSSYQKTKKLSPEMFMTNLTGRTFF